MRKVNVYLLSSYCLVASLLLSGCSHAKPVGLAIVGYNYTNQRIEVFSVTDEKGNSAGGDSLQLSTPTSGGGGLVCCVMLDTTTKRSTRLHIWWRTEAVIDKNGRILAPERENTREVTVSPPFPPDPGNFEVHFYPDGHVEAAVTQYLSEPRIKLPEGRGVHP
ncbi:hypothetical protein JOE11_005557 [Robbsia andropogonis]|uniref:DUF3304 domain-containing protein n=1 Tax=Robbsia andropogonis TaxID=28092 RepID=UPI003D21D898